MRALRKQVDNFIQRKSLFIILVWIILLSTLYSALSILRHNHFQSGGFDLGLYDQGIWQMSRFLPLNNTIKERFLWGDHLTLTLPLIAPLFWMWDNVRILLIFQALWISASAFAVYKLTLLRKLPHITAIVVSFAYSLFYGIQYAVFFDFHPVVLGTGLVAWICLFLEQKKKRLFWLSVILLLLTQENMGIALISLACIYFYHASFRKTSLMLLAFGIIWTAVAGKLIAFWSPTGFQYWPQISLNPIPSLLRFFDNPEKRQVLFYTFSSFSFLWLLSPGALVAAIFDLAQYFVTGPEFSRMWSPFMHHRVMLAPFVTLGALEVLTRVRKRSMVVLVFTALIAIGALVQQYTLHMPLNKVVKRIFWQEESWMNDNRKLMSLVPKDASIATQQNFVPHLSHRKEIYIVWPRLRDFTPSPCEEKTCWWLDYSGKPEYLVVDTRPDQWLTQILDTNDHWLEAIGNMERGGKIQLYKQIGFAKLYRISYNTDNK